MIVRARAPLRLGIAGGGTDVSPYCDTYGGYVLNASIDRYAYAILEENNENCVRFIASDYKTEQKYQVPTKPLKLQGDLDLHVAVYNKLMMEYNGGKFISITLTTFCDAPAGSGLGSSSTLVVAMIKAFAEYLNLALDDYEIALLAFKIERIDCLLNGGKQDQYSATFGGFNFIEFYENNRTIVNPLRIKNWILCELEASLLLFYTGVSRESAKIITEQSKNLMVGSEVALNAMHGIKSEALIMKECLLRGDFQGIVESMRLGWENKKKSASAVSSQNIDEIYTSAIISGALAGKVSGAGGGGFMMFFVPPNKRMNVVHSLNKFNGQISNCHFTKSGAQAWRI
jgi:D-glycero-alpha-D-manno-heptose-7-phosphate kinase